MAVSASNAASIRGHAEAGYRRRRHGGCEGVWVAKNDEEVENDTYVEDGENGNLVKEVGGGDEREENKKGGLFGAFKG